MSEPLNLRNAAPTGQVSQLFLQGMVDRMAMSYHKYGHIKHSFPEPISGVGCIEDRLRKYLQTHNTEWLMDVANYCMIEFMYPSFEDAHFRATSAEESPGRIMTDGKRTMHTKEDDENLE